MLQYSKIIGCYQLLKSVKKNYRQLIFSFTPAMRHARNSNAIWILQKSYYYYCYERTRRTHQVTPPPYILIALWFVFSLCSILHSLIIQRMSCCNISLRLKLPWLHYGKTKHRIIYCSLVMIQLYSSRKLLGLQTIPPSGEKNSAKHPPQKLFTHFASSSQEPTMHGLTKHFTGWLPSAHPHLPLQHMFLEFRNAFSPLFSLFASRMNCVNSKNIYSVSLLPG